MILANMIMTCRIHTQQGLSCNVACSPAEDTEWTLWINGNAFCSYSQGYQPKMNQLSCSQISKGLKLALFKDMPQSGIKFSIYFVHYGSKCSSSLCWKLQLQSVMLPLSLLFDGWVWLWTSECSYKGSKLCQTFLQLFSS